MAKDPAFLFYPGDYLRDTQCLSEKSQVAYDRIMCEHMRNICKDMSNITISQEKTNFFTKRLSDDERAELMHVLKKVGSGFQIEWVAESISKRKSYSESRSKNRGGKGKKDMLTYESHMENENENVIEDVNDINNWEKLILENRDSAFEQLLMVESRNGKNIEPKPDWVKQHTVKAIRDKWNFKSQQDYRVSLMGYLRSCNNGHAEKVNTKKTKMYN